jgi:hypothetical protein
MLDDAKSDMEGLNCSTTPSVSLGSGLRPGEDAYPVSYKTSESGTVVQQPIISLGSRA